MKTFPNIVRANAEDVSDLEFLVETCYRGDLSKNGWTTEADLFEGPRVTPNMLKKDMANPDVTIFKCISEHNHGIGKAIDNGTRSTQQNIIGCVRAERLGNKIHMGMFCVHPDIQNRGLGRRLMEKVEKYARECGCRCVEINVLLQRTELLAWYERRGFIRTGETVPLPEWDGCESRHKCPLDILVLEKVV